VFKNYLKVAIRNILRRKGYSFINIFGLSIGMACFILISLFVLDELSYDKFNEKADHIYRVCYHSRHGSNEVNMALTPVPMAEALKKDFPEVIESARVRSYGFPVFRYKEKVFSEEKVFWVDNSIFKIFTIPFIQGNPETALEEQNSIVVTKSMAQKYFGEENPIGKSLNSDNRMDYLVTGVVEDVPKNSHFHYDFLASLSTLDESRSPFWLSYNYYTYLVLKEGVDYKNFEKKLEDFVRKYAGTQFHKALGITLDQLFASGGAYGYYLQPLTDIHLHSSLDFEIEPNSDIFYVYIFSVIAIAVLLLACINFINLTTAISGRRSREVGIRKTLGSHKKQLLSQFLSESVLMSLISLFIALFFVELLLPWFNNLSGKGLSISYFGNSTVLPLSFFLMVFVGILAGFYPAFVLTTFKPVTVLKGVIERGGKTLWLRSGLVIFQFTISIIFFIGTFVVSNQLDYIQNKKMGFEKEQLVTVKKTDDIGKQIGTFKQELLDLPGVIGATNSSDILPGGNFSTITYKMDGLSVGKYHNLKNMYVDHSFIDTYKIDIAEGRFFSKDFSTDNTAVVINQTALKNLGLSDPIGKVLRKTTPTPGRFINYKIIGVVKDFHFESFHQEIKPIAIELFSENGFGRYLTVRVKPQNIKSTLQDMEKIWSKFTGGQPFEYIFFDENFAKFYSAEQRTGHVFTVFSVLAICIACLGLFGLVAFTTEQKTKEIGIRKVLGASVSGIVLMLSKVFIRWVLFATFIAVPFAYLIMKRWLEDFAYRISIGIDIFILSGFIALIIALLTVSYLSIKSATANPVDSLRYE